MSNTSVHIQSLGKGPDLVMLHGWAMHGGFFESVTNQLAQDFCVHVVDIPGHGKSRTYPEPYSIENLASEILQNLSPLLSGQAIWLGWSLGGSIATWVAAQEDNNVSAVILVASNPRFVQQADWPHGIEEKILQEFASELGRDYEKTLSRFLSLQIRGAENQRELLRSLRTQMRCVDAPVTAVLNGGLEILRHYDGRELLLQLRQPVLMMAGQRDTLVPVTGVEAMAQASSNISTSIWPGTGHIPFISDPDRFSREVKAFSDGIIS